MSGILTQTPTQATPHRANHPSSQGPNPSTPPGGGHHGHHLSHVHHPHRVHHLKVLRWSTPNLLLTGGFLIGALALGSAVVTTGYASSAHGRISAVDLTDAPSVEATSDFLLRIEDMDAQLANALLIGGDTTLATTRATSMGYYETDRAQADADLQAATAALSGDRKSLDNLAKVAYLFGTYQESATRALQLDEQAGDSKAGGAPPSVVAAYRVALVSLAGQSGAGDDPDSLLSQAQNLHWTSSAEISQSAQRARATLTAGVVGTLLVGGLPLGALVFLQLRLGRTFHRTLNRALLGASLVSVVFMVAGVVSFLDASDALHNAKSNAFDSVQALTRAKAVSYSANADESRWLLDRDHAIFYEASFLTKAQQIASAQGDTVIAYEASMARPASVLAPDDLANTDLDSSSAFGVEFRNLTFPGESDAALRAFNSYTDYLMGDNHIRQFVLSTPQGLHDAIDFDTDAHTPGTSDETFGAYSRALDQVIALNQKEFDASMATALSGIAIWSWLPSVFLLLIVGLTALGLRPRLREYR